ncbi:MULTISPECIES: MerR family transcriptional regulator [Psychrilyobacter]|uniref:MerR family transcriptional regulator n=1 Tax=Psychrilyobacter piezotolerans TaxID=2293438 RepID=A0ABX9KHB7_9FUSO|nr:MULTISPECIES: MerR family transcriptional regulator [Psychrilyobacter]MCS5420665.1 MerR family transcriptional regulator [Psychrilyobacter sp. S5]NDI77839.1 MerR family transcriptional regulator [Psychrilyobacter piezotolerans]RDE62307.1 MerR family transcriptional regulator [Psychrilyobacter sp. S5]REI41405.1 MerR family transcriptional regulator [Psychrilyobacter piezotolerans]
MSDTLKKNEVSKILGMSRSTIRYYEQVGLIKPPIDDNNYRGYGIKELKLLSQISFLRTINLDIDTIGRILHDKSDDSFEILVQKKRELNDLIKFYKNNVKKIEEILQYNSSKSESINYQILKFPNRYLYKIKLQNEHLDGFYKENEDFFQTNTVSLEDWFINITDANVFLNESNVDFIECIEVKEDRNKEFMLIPKGKFACFDITFENNNSENWKAIADKLKRFLFENSFETRDEKILFLNKDNLNLNFADSRRMLSIQVPIV